MLKLSCNGVDRIQLLAQCGYMNRPTSVFSGRSSVTGFRSTKACSVQAVTSAKDGVVVNRVEPDNRSFADRLRLGSLTEDGLSYKEKFIVRSYEVGINKTATVETIANLLQVFSFFGFLICEFCLLIWIFDPIVNEGESLMLF